MEEQKEKKYMFMYGTLLRGFSNHSRTGLNLQKYVGKAVTIDRGYMEGIASHPTIMFFPVMNFNKASTFIQGEVFLVDKECEA